MRVVRYYPRAMVGDGGITQSVWRHSKELAARGVDVVIAYDEDGAPRSTDGVSVARIPHGGRWWKVSHGLDRVLDGADVLVLHSGWVAYNLKAASDARRLGVPYILEPRGAYDPAILNRNRLGKRLFWALWEGRLVDNARAVHVFFDQQRQHIESLGYTGSVLTVPNGVDMPGDVTWRGANSDFALWLGRFDPDHKGLDLLVRAMKLLPPDDRPQLRMHGPDWRSCGKRKIRSLVARLELEPWVQVGDPVYGHEKFELMAAARCFVYPSRWEAFGNAVAEAAAVGAPLLVTGYPLGRHLADRGAAIAVDADPEALAGGLARCFSEELHCMGRNGREIATEFQWSHVAETWLQQTRTLLQSARST